MSEDRAVIFDMDGVLVDSYYAHYQSWREVAEEEGLSFSMETFDRTFGRTSREIIREVWQDRAVDDATVAMLDRRKEEAYRRIITQNFPAMPGVEEMLDRLSAAGFKLAIGSSGPAENVELVLNRLERCRIFGAVVSGRDVERGKPDPQVFLLAAHRLGVSPARCVVVEDAPLGIEAARRASMKAIGLTSTGRTRQQLAFADAIVGSLGEITPEFVVALLDNCPDQSRVS